LSLVILGITGLSFLVLTIADTQKGAWQEKYKIRSKEISEILLLGEDNNITDTWDIYGKTSIVFGRDEGENQVDVNLKNTDYAGTIDGEHAVMNYSNGCWYIEDLDSENGTRIQRGGKGKKYKVSSREPCRVGQGDVIYLGLAPIRIQ
ncbi:MAG: FHA domain-containing protein, partial [Acetatifactor sp.]|nr:FHA domain-containing protein [Acetatifactor sp.]